MSLKKYFIVSSLLLLAIQQLLANNEHKKIEQPSTNAYSDIIHISFPPRPQTSIYIPQSHYTSLKKMMYFANSGRSTQNSSFPRVNACKEWTSDNFKEHALINYGYHVVDESRLQADDYYTVINNNTYAITKDFQRVILHQHHLYWNKNYIRFIQTLPEYESYILELDKRLSTEGFLSRTADWVAGNYYIGFEDLVTQKASIIRIEQAQKAARLVQERAKKTYKKRLEKQLGPQLNKEKKYLTREKLRSNVIPEYCQDARNKACEKFQEHVLWSHKTYTISNEAEGIITKYTLDAEIIKELDGHQVQHALHQEFIEIIDATAKTPELAPLKSEKIVVDFAHIGVVANRSAFCMRAIEMANFCWGLLTAAVEGVGLGLKRATTPFMHPRQTVHELGQVCSALGTILYSLGQDFNLYAKSSLTIQFVGNLETILDELPETATPDCDALVEAFRKCQENTQENKKIWNAYCAYRNQQIATVIKTISEQIAQLEARDFVRETVALVVDAKTTAKLLGALGEIFKRAQVQLILKHIKKLQEKKAPLPAAITSEGIHLSIVERALGTVEKNLSHVVTEFQQLAKTCIQTIPGYTLLEAELPYLRKMFDGARKGFNEFANKFIKLPYEHILSPEFCATRRGFSFKGFHHDFLNALEKNNVIKFVDKVYNKFGCYSAKLHWNGNFIKDSTFFPAHWTREQVIAKIYEAYDNFIIKGAKIIAEEGGKYRIRGNTSEGIIIEMLFTKKGHIISAYPIVELI